MFHESREALFASGLCVAVVQDFVPFAGPVDRSCR
jgi:hypothetical protein